MISKDCRDIAFRINRILENRLRIVNKYTPEGREAIHKNLVGIDMSILHYLMRNPVGNQTIEYNDNRLSLYCAQKGKSSEKQLGLALI